MIVWCVGPYSMSWIPSCTTRDWGSSVLSTNGVWLHAPHQFGFLFMPWFSSFLTLKYHKLKFPFERTYDMVTKHTTWPRKHTTWHIPNGYACSMLPNMEKGLWLNNDVYSLTIINGRMKTLYLLQLYSTFILPSSFYFILFCMVNII